MFLPGARNQPPLHELLTFDGTITAGGTAQLLLPQQPGRAYLLIQNTSSGNLMLGVGPATATATVTSAKVASVAVNNGGLSYTEAPQVIFLGGLTTGDLLSAPSKPATAIATLAAGAVSAISVTDGGAGYTATPTVYLFNPYSPVSVGRNLGGGAFLPSATAGLILTPNGQAVFEATFCPTSAVAIYGGTTGQAFACKVAF